MYSLRDMGGGGLVAKSHPTLGTPWTVACPAPLSIDSPSKNTGVGYHFLLQRIFPIQRSNLGPLRCKWILYQLNYKGSPRDMGGIIKHTNTDIIGILEEQEIEERTERASGKIMAENSLNLI